MITCPLCDKPLYLYLPQDPETRIEITASDKDFYCDTYVNIAPGVRWGHYGRWTSAETEEIFYTTIVPPFRIIWASKKGEVTADRIVVTPHKPGSLSYSQYASARLLEDTNIQDLQAFLRICNRFQNLKAFS